MNISECLLPSLNGLFFFGNTAEDVSAIDALLPPSGTEAVGGAVAERAPPPQKVPVAEGIVVDYWLCAWSTICLFWFDG